MSSLYLTARRAGSDALTTVSAASTTLTQSLNSLSHLAATGAAHAEQYRKVSERQLALDSEQSIQRKLADCAREDADFFADLFTDLHQHPDKIDYYNQALQAYAEVDADMVAKIRNRDLRGILSSE